MPSGGDSVGPDTVATTATIGCFAEAITAVGRVPVALTAMHLVTDAALAPSMSLRFVSPSWEVGKARPLGTLLSGTTRGVDAAAIRLGNGVLPTRHIHGIGIIKGYRALREKDEFTAVRMFGAGSGHLVIGRIESLPMAMPDLDLDDAFFVSLDSVPGDSGAALVSHDDHIIGLLKGRYPGSDGLAVGVTITSVLAALKCTIP